MPTIVYGMQKLAQNATGLTVPNSGHWIAEEQPDFVLDQLSNSLEITILKLNKST